MPWGATIDGMTAVQQRWTYASQRLGETVGRIVTKRLDEAVQFARTTYLTGGTTSTRLAERSGRLKQAFTQQTQVAGSGGGTLVTAQLGFLTGPSWVGIHEHGGTIRAKRAKYLAIPLNAIARSMPPRHLTQSFVARSRAGSLIIFQKQEGGGIAPMYLLRESVYIPARPALAPTVSRFEPLILNDLKGAVAQMFRGQ